MKNLKFKVHSPEHSEAIQKRLFELGYGWYLSGKVLKNKDVSYLFCDIEKNITYSTTEKYFNSHDNQLATLDDLYKDDREQLTVEEVESRFNVKVIGLG
jgi:hypothetical protein